MPAAKSARMPLRTPLQTNGLIDKAATSAGISTSNNARAKLAELDVTGDTITAAIAWARKPAKAKS